MLANSRRLSMKSLVSAIIRVRVSSRSSTRLGVHLEDAMVAADRRYMVLPSSISISVYVILVKPTHRIV